MIVSSGASREGPKPLSIDPFVASEDVLILKDRILRLAREK